jgi:hypothetical protein
MKMPVLFTGSPVPVIYGLLAIIFLNVRYILLYTRPIRSNPVKFCDSHNTRNSCVFQALLIYITYKSAHAVIVLYNLHKEIVIFDGAPCTHRYFLVKFYEPGEGRLSNIIAYKI